MDLNKLHRVYFLGIGGIGMSALARYFHSKGIIVSGYDKSQTPLTNELIDEGIKIHFEDNIDLIPRNIDLVVYTPAIPESNKEYQYFVNNNFELLKRAEVLGKITHDKFTIAIAGTHGKTTISSIIAHILKFTGHNVTALIGGICKNYNSNFISSENTEVFVVEADEYDRSFLTLHPDIEVISSIDADHLDIYGSKKYLNESFKLFAEQIKSNGRLIIKKGIDLTVKAKKNLYYSATCKADFYSSNIRVEGSKYLFDLNFKNSQIKNINFKIPGKHNIENAVAASAVGIEMGIKIEKIKEALETYSGVKRRFDIKIQNPDIIYIDDYAHHPEELKACISSVKELYPDKKITGIFQPHLYTRTKDFADEFAKSLDLLDKVILLNIYPARELPIEGVSSEMILEKIKIKNKKICSNSKVFEELKNNKPEVLLTLGAGDIDKLVEPIENILKS